MTPPEEGGSPSERIKRERDRNAAEGDRSRDSDEDHRADERRAGRHSAARGDDADRASPEGTSEDESRHAPDEPASAPHLDQREKRRADEEEELNVSVTYEVIRRAGRDELRRSSSALFWSGLAAGLSMGFSFLVEAYLKAHLPEADWTPLVSKLGYSVGFLAVILGAQQLFTENTLNAVIPLLAQRSRDALLNTARLWAIVLVANLIGAFAFAAVLSQAHAFQPEAVAAFDDIAAAALSHGVGQTFLLAIFAGWLIALMVWMLPAAQQLAVVVIVVMTYIVGLLGAPHIVAGSVEVFYAGLQGNVGWATIAFGYILPTLLGNSIGGVALVSGLAHAQVVAGKR
jgi:formate-nitrite transporter family protein